MFKKARQETKKENLARLEEEKLEVQAITDRYNSHISNINQEKNELEKNGNLLEQGSNENNQSNEIQRASALNTYWEAGPDLDPITEESQTLTHQNIKEVVKNEQEQTKVKFCT